MSEEAIEQGRILIVDDEKVVRTVLEQALKGQSLELVFAKTAQEAADLAFTCGPFDLALVDKNLPDRSGLKLTRELRAMDPDLEIDGEMQADTAVDFVKMQSTYPFSRLTGPANVLVFSRLSAANAAYKLLDELGGADVIGPVLLGMAKPVHILQRSSSLLNVLNLATIASVEWQARMRQR